MEERPGCFAFIVFWMSCYFKCPVALAHVVVGWSAASDCGIYLSYSLAFLATTTKLGVKLLT